MSPEDRRSGALRRRAALSPIRRWGACALTVFLVGALGACASSRPETDDDLEHLLDAYRRQNLELERTRAAQRERGIETLAVEPGAAAAESRVTATLRNAQLDVVVHRILELAGVGFVTGSPRPLGAISAQFEKLPLIEALRSLLGPSGLTADLRAGLVEIRPLAEARDSADPEGPADDPVSMEVPLTYVQTERAAAALDALFPPDENDRRRVDFAPVPEYNAILLSGSPGDVAQARRVLQSLDHDPGHVLLEALVVEFNVSSFLEIGSRIENGSHGAISDFFLDFADLVGDTLSFTRVADAANTTAFRAVLKLLMERDEARVISRPYLATVSGSRARLEVAEDRFVLVSTPGEINVNLEPVSSGVTLDLLPTLAADGSILLDLSIEQSQFQPTLENVEQRRARNSVASFARVADGQTVIVGGLMLRSRSSSKAGIPGLRGIPPFNLLFGHREATHEDSQVMFFITPSRWEPGMDARLEAADRFEVFPVQGPEASDPAGQ